MVKRVKKTFKKKKWVKKLKNETFAKMDISYTITAGENGFNFNDNTYYKNFDQMLESCQDIDTYKTLYQQVSLRGISFIITPLYMRPHVEVVGSNLAVIPFQWPEGRPILAIMTDTDNHTLFKTYEESDKNIMLNPQSIATKYFSMRTPFYSTHDLKIPGYIGIKTPENVKYGEMVWTLKVSFYLRFKVTS